MLCKECNKSLRPVVAIDIDGTLADYHGHFFRFAEMYWNNWAEALNPVPYDGSMELHEYLGLSLEEYRAGKLAYRQGGWKRSMPCISGAGPVLREIRKRAEVFITTTRPYLRLDQTDPDTREWLRRNGIEYDGLLYHEDKYKVLSRIVHPARVVAVVDDLSYQYDAAAEHFGPDAALLMVNGYNDAMKRPNMILGAIGIADAVKERIDRWYAENA